MQVENLKGLDSIEIITLADNSIELWTNPKRSDVQRFYQWRKNGWVDEEMPLVAGVGLSFWIRMNAKEESSTILLDVAESNFHISTNVRSLGLPLSEIEAVIISHGHDDHYGGLEWILDNCKQDISVVLHPRALFKKGAKFSTKEGERIVENMTMLSPDRISELGGKIAAESDPIMLSNGLILRTGEIPRVTEYEKGRPGHLMLVDGNWVDDQLVLEDVSLVAKVKGKGLVVITGCSHAGIVNIVKEAIRLTGEKQVHAIIGGFHLAGSEVSVNGNPSKLERTISDLKEFEPKLLVPCHCTGWRSRHAMSVAFPEAYVEGSVGHRFYILGD